MPNIPNYSIHCFNNYRGHGKCIDMEISYYIECYEKVQIRNKRSESLSCLAFESTTQPSIITTTQPSLPKVALILSSRADTNKPFTASFDGEFELKLNSFIDR